MNVIISIIDLFKDPNLSINDLINLFQNGDLQKILDMITNVLNGTFSSMPGYQVNPLANVPDFAKLLGLSNLQNFEQLKQQFMAHVQFVVNNFDGPIKDALISLLKLSYGQAYAGMKANGSF